jgi:predicted SnoaL-like aldol condensation-catalyzing enzyme
VSELPGGRDTPIDSPLLLHAGAEKATVQRYFTMWNTGDTSAVEEIISSTFVQHSEPPLSGPAQLANSIIERRANSPSLHVLIDAVLGQGPIITVVGRIEEQVDGGRDLRSGVWTIRVDEQIQEIWTYIDRE